MHRLRALLTLLIAATLPFSGSAWAGTSCCPQASALVSVATTAMDAAPMDHAHMHHAGMAMPDGTDADDPGERCCGRCADRCAAGPCGFAVGLLPNSQYLDTFSSGAQRAHAAGAHTVRPHLLELNRPPIRAVT
jgi:hypothetical protein